MKAIIATLAILVFSSSATSSPIKDDLSYGVLMSPKIILCDNNNRPKMCPSIYRPVCALKKLESLNEDGSSRKDLASFVNEGSPCMACGDPDVIAYYEGNCAMERSKVI